jgi:hypothetical protein
MLHKVGGIFVATFVASLLPAGAHASAEKRYACEHSCVSKAKDAIAKCRDFNSSLDEAEMNMRCPPLTPYTSVQILPTTADQALLKICISSCINNPDFDSSSAFTRVLKLVPNLKANCDAEVAAEVPTYCQ